MQVFLLKSFFWHDLCFRTFRKYFKCSLNIAWFVENTKKTVSADRLAKEAL